MSKYTTEVRFICETSAGYVEQQGFSKIENILETSAPLIFDSDIPIFDEDYRLPLEKKILRHFYTREIAYETVALWKLHLNERMKLIMPYYNKLYESELLVFNPLHDTDLTTTHTLDKDGKTTNDGTANIDVTHDGDTTNKQTSKVDSESTTKDVGTKDTLDAYSDTPQGAVSNLQNYTYLTNARDVDEDTTNTRNYDASSTNTVNGSGTNDYTNKTDSVTSDVGTSTSTEDYVENIVGKRGSSSYSTMILDFRKTFLNIDEMVINELNDLFFNLW